MRMLCIAAKADPPGYVTVNGKTVGATELALLTGRSEAEILPLLRELEGASVFSRDRHGRIYNRRMVRDTRIADRNRKNGAKGGNPKLLQPIENKGVTETGITTRITSKPKKVIPPIPYTQEDSSLRSESRASDEARAKPPSDREVAERLAASWREVLAGTGLPMPAKLTRKRIAAAAARWRGELGRDEAQWRAFLGRIRGSPFLLGRNDRNWKADFDWAIREDSMVRTLEGKYAPRAAANGHAASDPDPTWTEEDQWRARLELWRTRGSWHPNTWGPEPGAPGCCVPPRLLAEIDAKPRGETER